MDMRSGRVHGSKAKLLVTNKLSKKALVASRLRLRQKIQARYVLPLLASRWFLMPGRDAVGITYAGDGRSNTKRLRRCLCMCMLALHSLGIAYGSGSPCTGPPLETHHEEGAPECLQREDAGM